EQYAIGTFVAANNGWVLWHGCDERLTCQLHVGDAHDASRHALRWTDTAYPYPASLAPDGASALLSRSEYTFETEIVQLTTGRTAAVLGRVDRVAWSPDGAWAFAAVNDGIVAVSTRDGRRVDILSPFTTVIPSEQMQLAVG
ncbi:MAG TPA: hypothetical protein VF183_06040, partial [Acidimicrobiales bacterium]